MYGSKTRDNEHPPPRLPLEMDPYSLFVLLPCILHHYNWENDTIDGFKSRMA